jgi:hypothetical protein
MVSTAMAFGASLVMSSAPAVDRFGLATSTAWCSSRYSRHKKSRQGRSQRRGNAHQVHRRQRPSRPGASCSPWAPAGRYGEHRGAAEAEAAFFARPGVVYAVSNAFALNLSAVPSYGVPVDRPPRLARRGGHGGARSQCGDPVRSSSSTRGYVGASRLSPAPTVRRAPAPSDDPRVAARVKVVDAAVPVELRADQDRLRP